MYYELTHEVWLKALSLPLPPEWKDGDWMIAHSPDGLLARLVERHYVTWMGNDYKEKREMMHGALRMRGDVLVLGLGMGLVLQYMDLIGKCKRATVVERSPEVARNVGPWIQEQVQFPVEIIVGDDKKFLAETDRRWTTMFADTWELCPDALSKIECLKMLAKDKVRGRKVYWAEQELKDMVKSGR